MIVPAAQANLAKIPDGLTDEDVVLCPDIMSTGFSGAESGRIRIGDTELSSLGDKQLTRLRRDSVGFVFQAFNLIPTLTALENVELPLLLTKLSAAERKRRVVQECLGYNPDDRGHPAAKRTFTPPSVKDVANLKLKTPSAPITPQLVAVLEAEGWPFIPERDGK